MFALSHTGASDGHGDDVLLSPAPVQAPLAPTASTRGRKCDKCRRKGKPCFDRCLYTGITGDSTAVTPSSDAGAQPDSAEPTRSVSAREPKSRDLDMEAPEWSVRARGGEKEDSYLRQLRHTKRQRLLEASARSEESDERSANEKGEEEVGEERQEEREQQGGDSEEEGVETGEGEGEEDEQGEEGEEREGEVEEGEGHVELQQRIDQVLQQRTEQSSESDDEDLEDELQTKEEQLHALLGCLNPFNNGKVHPDDEHAS